MRVRRALSILLVAMLAVGILPAAASGAVKAQSAPVGTEFQITTEVHSQNQIEFWGDTVVYKDHRGGQPRIYGFDLAGNSEFPVSITTGTQNNPSVYGDYVVHMKKRMVWDDADNEWEDVGDIWGYKISTGENFPISEKDAGQCNPFIYGDRVVWVDWSAAADPIDESGGDYADIVAHNLVTGVETTIAAGPGNQRCVSMDEDTVVYVDNLDWNNCYLYAYDLAASTETTIAGPFRGIADPAVDGDTVVWHDLRNASWDVWSYDLATDTESAVSTTTSSAMCPDIWNDMVVWRENRSLGTGEDIYMKDLLTGIETTICADPAYQGRPKISNGTVVWTDERNADLMGIDNADVYGMYLMPHTSTFAGDTRYETAVVASRRAFGEGADTVVIATGANWPDALAASGLAGAVKGPVLLVKGDEIPAVVINELNRLGARNAYLIGGTSAICAAVQADLDVLLSGDVERIGGATRYETASMVSAQAVDLMGASDVTAILASGVTHADAVSASALAAGLGMPLYLTKPDAVPADVKAAMHAADVGDVYIVGGTAVVSDAVKSDMDASFDAVERLYGADRYATSLAIAEEGVDLGLTWDGVGFATGADFPDALAGGVVQGVNGSVLLLTPGDAMNAGITAALQANKADIGLVRFYGGTAAIGNTVRDAIEAIINS